MLSKHETGNVAFAADDGQPVPGECIGLSRKRRAIVRTESVR